MDPLQQSWYTQIPPPPEHPIELNSEYDLGLDSRYTSTEQIGADVPRTGYCAGCRQFIRDRHYLSAIDRDWHVTCLVCAVCRIPLDSHGTCYTKDGQIYCKQDYFRRYGWKQCSRCGASIAATELVMRVKELVYHIDCFTCVECNDRFTPGQQFALVGTSIYCRTHYHQMLSRVTHSVSPGRSTSPPPPNLDFKSRDFSSPQQRPTASTYYESVASSTTSGGKSRTSRKRKSPPTLMSAVPSEMTSYGVGMSIDCGGTVCDVGGGSVDMLVRRPTRQKRMRTSFKHHELRIMKSYFALNHNPDAKDLKQLSIKTGLSKRVLQVWFQNARAKYRRNALKEPKDVQSQQKISVCSDFQSESSRLNSSSSSNNNNNNNVIGCHDHVISSTRASVSAVSVVQPLSSADDDNNVVVSPSALVELNPSHKPYCQIAQPSPTLVSTACTPLHIMSSDLRYVKKSSYNPVT